MKNVRKIVFLAVLLLAFSLKSEACWPVYMLDWYGNYDDASWTSGGGSGGSGGSGNLPVNITGNFSQNQNYIITSVPYKAVDSGTALNNTNSNITIQYFDGLGRPIEQVQAGITPLGRDLVTYQEYDAFGREDKTWLPAVVANNNGAFIDFDTYKSKSASTYNNTAYNFVEDAKPYAYPVYEPSPLNRVIEQYGPGANWQNNGRSVKTDYQANSGSSGALSCALFSVTGAGIDIKVNKNNFYADAQLYVTKTTDEDGNIGYTFKDKLGQVLLTRQMLNGIGVDTYYVYDDFGNLCFVLPPMAADSLSNGIYDDTNNTPIRHYAYVYKYDSRNRCIAKKIPGAEWIYCVYDNADRLIFTQDGENRKKNEWQFSIPDAFGRIVLTGTCKYSLNYAADKPLGNNVVKATFNTGRTNLADSYIISGITLSEMSDMQLLSANYYDNYTFMGMTEIPDNSDTQYNPEAGLDTRYTGGYTGLLTGTVTAQLAADGTVASPYLYSVMYYDYRGRLIQTKSNTHLSEGIKKEYIAYNFTGQPTGRKLIYAAAGKPTQTEIYNYTYDHAGRLTKEVHQLNGRGVVPIIRNTYDELGRLKTNTKGGRKDLRSKYTYNIRSWVHSIRNPLFKETLFYNDYSRGIYNGNISAMRWKLASETDTRNYVFYYNNLSWLTFAKYRENNATNYKYQTSYTYDKQGNIKTLQRYGKTGTNTYGLIDNLTLSHSGNQLLKVEDTAANNSLAESADFKNYANKPVEYTYNDNGAMTQDLNKGISNIQYNLLNLPGIIDMLTPTTEARNEYTYSATGQKLKAVRKSNPNYPSVPVTGTAVNVSLLTVIQTTDYVDNLIYEGGILKRILIDAGYIENGKYHYYVTDHLGSNRLVVSGNGTIVQKNNYYPFGMAFAETSAAEQGRQPYKYNNKELDQMNGLNLYDVSARLYDPAVPNTLTPDPLCWKHYSISPYSWCMNNPVRFVDMDGRDPGDIFKTPRLAARDWGMYYNGASILRGIEFGSTIYEVNKDGKVIGYSYSVAAEGKGDGHVDPSLPPKFEKEVADIHSHENYVAESDNHFSPADISDNDRRKNTGYLTTPDGSLKEYNSSTNKITVLSTDLPSDPKDPGRNPGQKNKVDPKETPPVEKQRAQTRVEQDKKPEVKIPDSERNKLQWAF